jgi:hypothetical protein
MSLEIDSERRRFFGAAALTFAAAELRLSAPAEAQTGTNRAAQPPPREDGSEQQRFVRTDPPDQRRGLERGLRRSGPAAGPVILLLHGWPYDIHSFVEVTPRAPQAFAQAVRDVERL